MWTLAVKNPPANAGRCNRCGSHPWVGKIPWRRAQQPTLVFLSGEFHGQRRLVGHSLQGQKSWTRLKRLSMQHVDIFIAPDSASPPPPCPPGLRPHAYPDRSAQWRPSMQGAPDCALLKKAKAPAQPEESRIFRKHAGLLASFASGSKRPLLHGRVSVPP